MNPRLLLLIIIQFLISWKAKSLGYSLFGSRHFVVDGFSIIIVFHLIEHLRIVK